MKRKTFILLFVLGLSLIPAVVRSQDQPDSAAPAEKRADQAVARQNDIVRRAEEVAATREVEAQQNFYPQVQRNNDLSANQQPEAGDGYKRANPMFQDRLRNVINRVPGSPGQSLVIRSSELDPKEQANLEEDLAVMSHLLEKSLGSSLGTPQGSSVLGVNLIFTPGHNSTRGLYLEGYGALFTLSVGFPLLPSAKDDEEKENPSTDSAWNEARQEVYGQQRFDGKAVYVRGEEYDERKVNRLKDTVLEALKNAIHIRGLKNDDFVTICVFGGSAASPIKVKSANKPGGTSMKELYVAESAQARSTILTIRIKKSDVDAFAKDKLNLDDFRKKAKITAYAGPDSSPGVTVVGGGGRTFGGGGGFGPNQGY